jgi:hypothetical protein
MPEVTPDNATPKAGPSRTQKYTPSAIEDWEDLDTDFEDEMSLTPKKSKQTGDSESMASSISRTSSPVKPRTSSRAAPSPRRRIPRRTIPPPSPRPREKPVPVTQESSPLRKAFGLFFSTIRIAFSVLDWVISPIKPYILLGGIIVSFAYIAYCVLIYYLLPRLPTFLLRTIGIILRPLGGFSIPLPSWETFNLSAPSDIDVGRGIAALSLPLSGLATGSCALLGIGCQASLLTQEGEVAKPIWGGRGKVGKPKIGEAQIAWALTQESRSARTIFESISTLGSKADVFEHIELVLLPVSSSCCDHAQRLMAGSGNMG